MGEMEKLPGVQEVALFGKGLHAVVKDGATATAAVRELLARLHLRADRIEIIVPSLEDVFVSLIEAHDRAEAPQEAVRG